MAVTSLWQIGTAQLSRVWSKQWVDRRILIAAESYSIELWRTWPNMVWRT